MIYNQWYVILESKELKSHHPLRIKRFSENLVLWRDENNEVSCIADEYCHRGASLSCGKIIKGKLECPFH
jgi:phenylpropionate dioxygenase-like ring-hydroxylating dioxygenase large terminal subunit